MFKGFWFLGFLFLVTRRRQEAVEALSRVGMQVAGCSGAIGMEEQKFACERGWIISVSVDRGMTVYSGSLRE